jgi:hypothetical protein
MLATPLFLNRISDGESWMDDQPSPAQRSDRQAWREASERKCSAVQKRLQLQACGADGNGEVG